MGIRFISDDILLVSLPAQPQQSDEFEMLNGMLSEKIDHDIVMDFTEVEMLTSESICGLLILAKLLAGAGHEFVLCSVPPAINDIFNRTGLLSVFEFADTEADAVTHVMDKRASLAEA
ncbi:MAG: STAS domain-containing protein [Phycisphaerales bacterium]|nr:MAG: STAS domain-containing protein [Phycisphaerales bacterium]UCF16069.1 MAG: STAS domain-containing protein [Phycisphaerales bacterium]